MNISCSFYSNAAVPASVSDNLTLTLRNMIEQLSVDTFYVGSRGSFNNLVQHTLRQLSKDYPHIRCHTVSAPLPSAILHRWMFHRADYIVTYTRHTDHNSSKFLSCAHRRGKIIFPL